MKNENDKLSDENKKLKFPKPLKSSPGLVNFNEELQILRKDIEELTSSFSSRNKNLSFDETIEHILHLKKVIEHRDGYKYFYKENGEKITREKDIHIMFDLTWANTYLDVNKEVNNGRGPADFKISFGKDLS